VAAAWLVLDWDQDHFHVLCAQSTRHGVKVTRAASWPHPEPFTPSTAERIGKALRDFMKAKQIAPTPVIFGLGRDRVFLKELRFPEIAPHEEANLVRFQTGKELTESIDNYVVDYVHLARDTGGGNRHVMTAAVRRDVVAMIQTLCQSAGLKLHAITPKLFGMAGALERAVYPEESPLQPNALNVVLAPGQRWAELSFYRGRRLLQAQALANGPLLLNEIKRNLAVFQAQHAVNLDVTGPECLYMFGDEQGGVQSSSNGHHLPIRMLNPLHQEPDVAKSVKTPACFAGAAGLADLWSQSGAKPLNLAAPRRMSAPVSVTKQRGIFYGAAAAVFLVVMIGMMAYVLSQKRAEIQRLTSARVADEKFLSDNAQERADLDAYRDWEASTIPWLDELYDLSARHPWEEGFRVHQLAASTAGTKKGNKDAFVAKITLSGNAPAGKETLVKTLNDAMARDGHVRPNIKKMTTRPGNQLEYEMKIDVSRQELKKFDTRLFVPPPRPPQKITIIEKKFAAKAEEEMKDDPDPEPDMDADPQEGGKK